MRDHLVHFGLFISFLVVIGCDSDSLGQTEPKEVACRPTIEFTKCVSIPAPDFSAIPDTVAAAAEKAAARLSVRRIQALVDQGGFPKADEPQDIPADLSKLYKNAILQSFAGSDVVRDTMYAQFRLWTKPYPLIESIWLTVHESQQINQVLENTGLTGIPKADSIIGINGFELVDAVEDQTQTYYLFETESWKNYRPVALELINVPQIANASSSGSERCFYGPCLDIEARIEAGGVRLSYVVEWDGCPVGCILERQWDIFVDQNGMVSEFDPIGDRYPR